MSLKHLACFLVIGCFAGLGGQQALAQSNEAPTKHKTIGQPSDAAPTPSLVVINADGARLEGKKLTLTGVQKSSIIFADRPERMAGHVPTSDFVKSWTEDNKDSFAKDPPNATVSVLGSSADKGKDAVVELTSAKLDGDNLVFDVKVLEGDLAGASGPAALFVDHWGYYWHPHGAFYAGMAVGAAAAAGAYPYYPPPYYPPYHPYRCGYYPYPPCY